MAYVQTTTGRNATCDGHVDALNSGKIKIYSSTPTLLATLTFGATAFGNAGASVAGRADANAITAGTAVATGNAATFDVCKSDDTVMGSGTCGTSGADMNFSGTVTITSGVEVSCSSFQITAPAS